MSDAPSYAAYVWPAWILSALTLLILIALSWRAYRRAQALATELEQRADLNAPKE